ncbi:DUF11 domain-containing protein [Spirosoma sp. HMF3257]|uniref:DUF11 domain-containing protein n=1 Tax=Spirosoma telluris TaxID=2183553 RepID=A0A327NNS5_9BACT|nr:DUF11 domain-containing protein [Spirosoma telluris]RAI76887.1 hypothetical protein HMF3257_26830 [Spirosoma telluris]
MNIYRHFLICALLSVWMICAATFSAKAQTAALQLSTQFDCASGNYLATIQIRASDATSFSIGTSSVFLTYDPSSLTFVGYQSLNFDTATLCGGQSLWENHSFDGSSPGLFNLTLMLNSNSISCPLISNSNWVDIGTITFGVRNPDGNPSLQFSTAFTSFNAVPANNGIIQIQQGQYVGVDQSGVLHCSPICSLTATATPGLCQSATNQYSLTGMVSLSNTTAGSLIITDGSVSTTLSVTANQSAASFTLAGLPSDGLVHTLSATLSGCGSSSTTYTAPRSCSVATVCSMSAVATAGICTSASNTYPTSAVIRLTNPIAGILTISSSGQSQTFVTTAVSSASFTASFAGLVADGLSHTITASLPGCSTTSATYTAPASCSVAPVCSLTATVTPGSCQPATNQYTLTGMVSLSNATAGSLIITDGSVSTTLSVTANQPAASFTLTSLISDGLAHTLSATLSGCGSSSTTYTAPSSCSVAPVCSMSTIAVSGLCTTTSNTYSASAVIRLTNPIAGILTVTTGTQSQTFITVAGSSASFTANFTGLTADGLSHTVTASLPGCSTTSAAYTAPAACSVAPACSASVVVTASSCIPTTNTYSTTVSVTLTNATATGKLTITDGPQSATFIISSTGTTTYTAVFVGLSSDGSTHTVTASLPGCSTVTQTYTAPGYCFQYIGSQVVLDGFVDKSKAKSGEVLTYTLVLTNTGTTTAANVIVMDSLMNGLRYLTNSATAPVGTTFTQGIPISTWHVTGLTAGQSLSLTFQAVADSSGILYNKAMIPGDTAIVCTSVPVMVCTGDTYLFQLTAASGRSSYKWFKDNIEIIGQTTNVLNVTAPGTYSLAVDNVSGKCPDFSCCPFIVEEDTLPTFKVVAIPVTCVGNVAQANGKIVLSSFNAAYTYQYSLGANFNEAASLSGSPKLIPADGVLANNLPNQAVGQPYTIRVYNASGCYTDTTVLLLPCVCGCQEHICVPFITQRTKRAIRIGDAR